MSIALGQSRTFLTARNLRRGCIAFAATAAALVLLAGPALAHITVTPDSVPAGSTTVLTFHVPNEESKADTVKVDVQIPTAHPIAQLLVQPVPGWSVSVKTITLAKPITTDDGTFNSAVSEVIWSGGKILPGQFQSFTISADPMPTGEGQVAFKAIQTYSNGDIVRWIDLQQPGLPAPEHPAPIVTLTTAKAPVRAAGTGTTTGGSSTDGLTRALALASLIIGVLAILLALTAGRWVRRVAAAVAARAPVIAATGRADPVDGQAKDPVLSGAKATTRRDQPPASSKGSARGGHAASTKSSGRRPQSRRRG
jgi:uncharacterized protein YcnI